MRLFKISIRVALVGSVILIAAGSVGWRYGWWPAIVPPAENAYVGLTREQIVSRLGVPDSRLPGHYGLRSLQWAKRHEPCETLTYLKWDGTVYISVSPTNGSWVCFSSSWLPKGGAY